MPTGILMILAVILLRIGSDIMQENDRKKARPRRAVRLFIPHYMKEDEYGCPVCMARFWKDYKVCPNCGTRFTGTREDDGEFMEEMVIWDDDD